MDNVFQQWFNETQKIQSSFSHHPNQQQYDATLKENYIWPYMHSTPVSMESNIRVADVGCAYGTMAIGAWLLGYRVTATDYNDQYVSREALADCNITFKEWDIYNPTNIEPQDRFDIVYFTEVLEHLDFNPVQALLHIRSIMKPGAKLVMSTPRREDQRNWASVPEGKLRDHWCQLPWDREGSTEDRHYHLYSQSELIELLDVCGFGVTGGGILWNGLGVGISAYKKAGDTSDTAARFYSECQEEQVYGKFTPGL